MAGRAFPIVYAHDVLESAAFYGLLGFEERFRTPAEGAPDYVAMRRGDDALGVVTVASPAELIRVERGNGVRFELFVYVEDVDGVLDGLRSRGVPVLREPADMPWGERIAYVADPDGNPVVLAAESP